MILIAEDCSIPILGDIIGRLTMHETGNIVLDDWVQSMSELQHNVCTFHVLCIIHQFVKFINILINRMGALMVLRCLQVSVSHLDLILWAKVMYELESELSPGCPGE